MAMAHGYYLVSGKMQMVGVHNNVGTANALCGLMNASHDHVPVLLVAGRAPITEQGSDASREVLVHWAQENYDQGGIVREQVKWDYELRAGQEVEDIIDRALDIAVTVPEGPVYLMLPREVLTAPNSGSTAKPRRRAFGAVPPQPNEEAIEEVAKWLASAKNPLIITSVAGRIPENIDNLSSLAEKFALPVAQHGARCVNLPSRHPMNLGTLTDDMVERADVILVLDCEIPWIRRQTGPAPETKVIHLGIDPLYQEFPIRGFEDDLAIAGGSLTAIPMLQDVLSAHLGEDSLTVAARRQEIAQAQSERQALLEEILETSRSQVPINPVWLSACIDAVSDDNTVIVNEVGLNVNHMELNHPWSLFVGPPVGGLGWSLGAGLGAKLAAPEKDVIVVLGDGSYMFANPTPSHYVATAENLPILTVVINNSGWEAIRRAVQSVYPNGRAILSNRMPLVHLDPSPAFEKVVEASGGWGERVTNPEDLIPTLKRAWEIVKTEKRQALVNVICG
jgi:acetolactate synthase-1/2/3 large subunit